MSGALRSTGALALALTMACAASPGAREEGDGAGASEPSWSAWGEAYAYFLPDDSDYVSAVVGADRGALHLEARYGYEDRETGSLWVGWNHVEEAESEDELELAITPMLGAVFGRTDGLAPGYRLSLALGPVEIASEGEYLFDFDGSEGNYFYAWNQLEYAPSEQLRVGLVSQRTRVFDTDREFERGILLGTGVGTWSLTAYFFEFWDEDRHFVLSAGYEP